MASIGESKDDFLDWSSAFGDDASAAATVHRARDFRECRELAAVAVETADDCRDFAEMALDAAHEAQRLADEASDAAGAARDALEEYSHTARICAALDVGVLIAAIVMLVLTLINFYWS